jgi:transposase
VVERSIYAHMIFLLTCSFVTQNRGHNVSKLSMRKISEILRQRHELKRSYREIGNSLNISISTITKYLALAKAAGLTWPLPPMSEESLVEKLFLPVKENVATKRAPDWEWAHHELRKKGVTLLLLWREYRDIYPDGYGYTSFCKKYRAYAKQLSPVMRQTHQSGEKIFVDYAGTKMPWLNPMTGEIHEAEIFVGALGASQLTFVEATATQTLPDWIQSHIHMFETFGGVSEIVVPDNLKSGVTKAHIYDPDINANYQHFSEHYGFAIVPARAAEPKDKAIVESAVGCITRQILAPLRHITFTSIGEINAAIKLKLDVFNKQSFQKMKTSRHALFESLDKAALKPLPKERYQYAEWYKAKINIDYHFVFDDHYYSVPYRYIHHAVEIRVSSKIVECFYQGKRIAAHQRSYLRYKFTTLAEHMPPAHRAQAEWTPERIKRWANKIGPQTTQYIDCMIAARAFPQQAFRSCLGLLRLAKRYGEDRLEKACEKAMAVGATRYQHVEFVLKNQMDLIPNSQAELTSVVLSSHENIRGSSYYK